MKPKVKINKAGLDEVAMAAMKAATDGKSFDIDCPHCGAKISVPEGKSACPQCQSEINLTLNFKIN